jgi:hypothetical protein
VAGLFCFFGELMAKRIDWDFVKRLYRAGGLSNCEIVRQYAEAHKDQNEWKPTISEAGLRKQAKLKGWKKDLADRVKKEVREKLVRGEYEPESASSNQDELDELTVQQAAASITQMIQLHRKDLDELKALEADLLRRLKDDENQVVIGWYEGIASEHEVKLGLKDRTQVYKTLVQSIGQRIKLERLAWGIDEAPDDPLAPDKIEIIQEF